MIISSLVFFSGPFHEKFLSFFFGKSNTSGSYIYRHQKIIYRLALVYIIIQLIIPLRFLFYPDHLYWTEEGYRFSWRVMLMEKAGAAYFTVKDKTGAQFYEVNNAEFLTPLQEKMMSTQPDLVLKYAHYLAQIFTHRGIEQPKVYASVYVTLNGAP
jgi:hypothetical protein